jgi:hypothetical protein
LTDGFVICVLVMDLAFGGRGSVDMTTTKKSKENARGYAKKRAAELALLAKGTMALR